MKKYIIKSAIALAALLFGTGTANASTDSYLARLNEEISRVVQQYGTQALVDEGGKVCGWAAQGVPNTAPGGIIDRVMRDLPMSFCAASWVQLLAEAELGCAP